MSSPSLEVLALCPYHGGSHQQFLEEWVSRSTHRFTTVSLPPRHMKWRMRQAAVGLSKRAFELCSLGERFDAIWTTALCNVAELRGLLPAPLRALPVIAYFHENQLSYPSRSDERDRARDWDVNLPLNNWTTALAADRLWFNSRYNCSSMLAGLEGLLKKMPDEHCLWSLDEIASKSEVQPPGIDVSFFRQAARDEGRRGRPLTLGWVARWEHDKRPELLLWTIEQLKSEGVEFRLICLGPRFGRMPDALASIQRDFSDSLEHFGFARDRSEYRRLLGQCDVVLSTAAHEFFGIALLEAVAAGCQILAPDRLVYPELYRDTARYPATDDRVAVAAITKRLIEMGRRKSERGGLVGESMTPTRESIFEFDWPIRARSLDAALTAAVDLT